MKNLSKRIMTIAASLALVVVVGICLTACGGNNQPTETTTELTANDYALRLTNAGYTVEILEGDALNESYKESLATYGIAYEMEWGLKAEKDESENENIPLSFVSMGKYKNEDNAKEMTKEFEQCATISGAFGVHVNVVRDGRIVVTGTPLAVDIALGKKVEQNTPDETPDKTPVVLSANDYAMRLANAGYRVEVRKGDNMWSRADSINTENMEWQVLSCAVKDGFAPSYDICTYIFKFVSADKAATFESQWIEQETENNENKFIVVRDDQIVICGNNQAAIDAAQGKTASQVPAEVSVYLERFIDAGFITGTPAFDETFVNTELGYNLEDMEWQVFAFIDDGGYGSDTVMIFKFVNADKAAEFETQWKKEFQEHDYPGIIIRNDKVVMACETQAALDIALGN